MAHTKSFGLSLAVLVLSGLWGAISGAAQSPVSRLAGDWRSTAVVPITASKPPAPYLSVDQGAAPRSVRLERMLLLLQPSTAQQQALDAELAELQDSRSAQYHHWLSPSAFAAAYANAPADVAAIAAWLTSEGFQVAPLPASLGWIEFSGTVGQVEQAFGTQVDLVSAGGAARPMLSRAISVPGAFQPLVQGMVSLDGVVSAAALSAPRPVNTPAATLAAAHALAQVEALTPRLAGQLLHWDGLQAKGVQGAGQSIAIAARSNLQAGDVAAFRATFGLPAATVSVQPIGVDPGLTVDEPAATLAASWAGAAAPGAQIVLVPAATTNATDGIDLSLAAIVDQKLATTVAVGYAACEASMSAAHQAFYQALYRQAAVEGISVAAATGDSGAAGCQAAGGNSPMASGYGVNALASTPWNTAVGTASFGAAGVVGGIDGLAAWSPAGVADPAFASGGGSSLLYGAPVWQSAVSQAGAVPAHGLAAQSEAGHAKGLQTARELDAAGLPSVNRLLPDLALPTAIDSGMNPGLAYCLSGTANAAGCTLMRSGGSAASTALFAGIAALVQEKHGAQGSLNSSLYALNASNGVFADVTEGSAQLPCAAGSAGCGGSQQMGFTASAGFDLTTGLGAINAQALVNNWPDQPQLASSTTELVISASANSITYADPLTLTATTNFGTPPTPADGTLSFYDNDASVAYNAGSQSALGSYDLQATLTFSAGKLKPGSYDFIAEYAGTTTSPYPSVISANDQAVTVAQGATNIAVSPVTGNPAVGTPTTVSATITAQVANTTAVVSAVGTVNFYDTVNGNPNQVASVAISGGTTASASVTFTSAGSHALTAQFVAASNSNWATSAISSQVGATVAQGATSTLLTVTPPPVPGVGSAYTLNAAISPLNTNSSATVNAVGTMNFYDTYSGNQTLVASVAISGGNTASASVTFTSAGNHTLAAQFVAGSGSNWATSNISPANGIAVAQGSTTTALTSYPANATLGAAYTLVATISPPAGFSGTFNDSGTVNFYDNFNGVNTPIGSAQIASTTTASVSGVSFTSAGNHLLTAQFVAASNSNWATSAVSPQVTAVVAAGAPTVTLTNYPQSSVVGTAYTLTATLAPPAGYTGAASFSGTVNFLDNGNLLGSTPFTSGTTASYSATFSTAGSHALTANYIATPGGNWANGSTQAPVNITVSKGTPALTGTGAPIITPATVTTGAPISISATFLPATLTITGTVTFNDNGTALGSVQLNGNTAVLNNAVLSTAGIHSITIAYGGDNNWASFTSPAASVSVAKGTPSMTLNVSSAQPAYATPVTFTVALSSGATVSSTYTITGSVSFFDGSNLLGSSAIASNSATYTTSALAAGAHSITATYSDDSNWGPASSAAKTVTVSAAPTVTTLTALPGSLSGTGKTTSVTFTAAMTPASSVITAYTIPGKIVFTDVTSASATGTVLGTVSVTNNSATVTAPLSNSVTHTITAVYSDTVDSNWSTSSGAVTMLSTVTPTTISLTANQTTVAPGGAVIFTAIVNPGSQSLSEAYPTGSVEFINTATNTLIGTAQLTEIGLSDESIASLSVSESSALPPGIDSVTVIYLGDAYYSAATSNPLTIDVQDFGITGATTNPPYNLNIVKGSTGTASFTVSALGGFNGQIQVTCSVPSQDYLTCMPSPQILTAPGTVNFVVTTFTTGGVSTAKSTPPTEKSLWPRAMGGTALALLGFFLLPCDRRARTFVRRTAGERGRQMLVLLLLLAGMGVAGVGCTSTVSSPTNGTTGTPLGVATLTINATINVDNTVIARTTYLTVNVVAQ